MLRGDKVGLRARSEADVPVLHAELHDDVAMALRSGHRSWLPIGPGPTSPYAVPEATDDKVRFSVVRLADDELVGAALLWGIDSHNRVAHLGISLRPACRGEGLGADTVRVLCRYAFSIRGLNRLQIETLADNFAMLRAATTSGFVAEGTLRQAAWVDGQFVDEVILGLLAREWQAL
jgi:RimJ/RimL family protein N-acetyltransferase